MILFVIFLAAYSQNSSDLAPVHTILPDANIKEVDFGSLMRMMQAANLRGLYSTFLALSAIFLKSNLIPRFAVATIFCIHGYTFGKFS